MLSVDTIASFITFLSSFNVLDYGIVLLILLYAFEGYHMGFLSACIDFISFIGSFILGLRFYSLLGKLFSAYILLPSGFANAAGFFVTAAVIEIILSIFLRSVFSFYARMYTGEKGNYGVFLSINKFLGLIPGIASAVILLSFVFTLIIALPFSSFLKQAIVTSKLGNLLVVNSQDFEQNLNKVFGQAVNETLTFLTVEPQSQESVSLHFTLQNGIIDSASEQKMFLLVNKERTSQGLSPLVFNERLADVGRSHAQDMFKRGYFSHYTPEGLSPFDRMAKANIMYVFAGENLALAPSVDIAMQGLMKSPGHRANILSADFKKVGIGAIDGGIYGTMFSQEFTD